MRLRFAAGGELRLAGNLFKLSAYGAAFFWLLLLLLLVLATELLFKHISKTAGKLLLPYLLWLLLPCISTWESG